jgi:hypothetical protein
MAEKAKHPGGRPTNYCQEIAQLVCDRVATHHVGIERLCNMYPDMPGKTTIREWKLKHDEFASRYALARQKQVENYAEDIIDIADDGSKDYVLTEDGFKLDTEHLNRSRLRIDTRKWMASKLAPKIYGDQKRVEELEGENERVKAELRELREKLDVKNKSEY